MMAISSDTISYKLMTINISPKKSQQIQTKNLSKANIRRAFWNETIDSEQPDIILFQEAIKLDITTFEDKQATQLLENFTEFEFNVILNSNCHTTQIHQVYSFKEFKDKLKIIQFNLQILSSYIHQPYVFDVQASNLLLSKLQMLPSKQSTFFKFNSLLINKADFNALWRNLECKATYKISPSASTNSVVAVKSSILEDGGMKCHDIPENQIPIEFAGISSRILLCKLILCGVEKPLIVGSWHGINNGLTLAKKNEHLDVLLTYLQRNYPEYVIGGDFNLQKNYAQNNTPNQPGIFTQFKSSSAKFSYFLKPPIFSKRIKK